MKYAQLSLALLVFVFLCFAWGAPQGAYLVILHAVPAPGASPISLNINYATDSENQTIASSFLFGNQTSFIVPWNTDYKLQIWTPSGQILAQANYRSNSSQPYLYLVLSGSLSNVQINSLDPPASPPSGKALIRFYNFMNGTSAVNMNSTNFGTSNWVTLFSNLAFGQASDALVLDPGAYFFEAVNGPTLLQLFGTWTLDSSKPYLAVVVGVLQSSDWTYRPDLVMWQINY